MSKELEKTKTHKITQTIHSDGVSQEVERKYSKCEWCGSKFDDLNDLMEHLQDEIEDYEVGIEMMQDQQKKLLNL